MPDLMQSLQGFDLGHLQIIAQFWGFDLEDRDLKRVQIQLVNQLLNSPLLSEIVMSMPEDAAIAFLDLIKHQGQLTRAVFTRRYGEIREMGPARRDRERPYELNNANPAETLFYRGLISRAFFDTPSGPQELVFIPEDMLAKCIQENITEILKRDSNSRFENKLDNKMNRLHELVLGRPAHPIEYSYNIMAQDGILDLATTLLAALRSQKNIATLEEIFKETSSYPLSASLLMKLLQSAGLVDVEEKPLLDLTRHFLEISRAEAMSLLFRGWLNSVIFDEIRLLPRIAAAGEWHNDPLIARETVLSFLKSIPFPVSESTDEIKLWWSLDALIEGIHQVHPDFLRPDGDYDSWYLRDETSGQYLRGFEHWHRIEGQLIRFVICGPLYWLGLVDLGFATIPEEGKPIVASSFRFSQWAYYLLSHEPPKGLPAEVEKLQILSDGRVFCPRLAPRSVRYQLARFCDWEGYDPGRGEYKYRISTYGLALARKQGLRVGQLISIMRHQAKTVPPGLIRALERWEKGENPIRISRLVVLRVKDPATLQVLRSSKAGRFLGEPIGNTAVVVKSGAREKVQAILLEMGYLADVELD